MTENPQASSCSSCCHGLSTRKSAWLLRELFIHLLTLYLALTTVPGWYSLNLNAVCALISSDLAPGKHFYMKGPAGYNTGEGNFMYMLKCIYGLVQAPRQYYMPCREVYQKQTSGG